MIERQVNNYQWPRANFNLDQEYKKSKYIINTPIYLIHLFNILADIYLL